MTAEPKKITPKQELEFRLSGLRALFAHPTYRCPRCLDRGTVQEPAGGVGDPGKRIVCPMCGPQIDPQPCCIESGRLCWRAFPGEAK